ncbi:transcription termination/antitermination protein NusG [Methylobacterium nigriterrae]|uniref:transcription termination/antitermination protein NusG n=1 Tax=Methylobacterium nigriterrae TaxID=3127512 RepID=UPI003013C365
MNVELGPAPPCGRALEEGERWYVVYAQPHCETSAALHLGAQNFRTFLPLLSKTVRHARKSVAVLTPLFPRYLFVVLDLNRDRWRAVNGTRGVASLVMYGGTPAPVRSGVVETLLASSSPEGEIRFEMAPGSRVRLVDGPFAGQLGVLRDLGRAGRVQVLIEMMGSYVAAELGDRGIVPAFGAWERPRSADRPVVPTTSRRADIARRQKAQA